jgi:uncharacterized protein YndB with AHSA1/START domain
MIHKPPQVVFAVLSDPRRFFQLTPETVLVGEPEDLAAGGFRARAATRWHQWIGYQYTITTEEYDPPHRIRYVAGEVERSPVARLLRARVAELVEYELVPESDESTQVTATVTWHRMPARSLWLIALLARRTMASQLRRLERLADSHS